MQAREPEPPFGNAALVLFVLACVTPFVAYAWSKPRGIDANIAALTVGVVVTVGSMAGALSSANIGMIRGERHSRVVRWFPLIWAWVMLVFLVWVIKG